MQRFIWKLKNFHNLVRQYFSKLVRANNLKAHGKLYAKVIKPDYESFQAPKRIDLGLISAGVVTDAFVNFLVDNLVAETAEIGDFKFHDSGTGTNAEAVGDTTLQTKVESGRVTGTQLEGATAEIYKTVATITYTGTHAIVEHGLFSQATGATLMDRSKFTAINVLTGEKIEFTYELTVTSGG